MLLEPSFDPHTGLEIWGLRRYQKRSKASSEGGCRLRSSFIWGISLSGLILLAGCSRPKPPATIAFEQKEWESSGNKGTQLLTEHFDLRVTAKDELLRDYLPGFMETTFAEYTKLMPPAK